ncbi:rhoptry protein, putative [Plasmodium vinckei vinckei]|uniref:Rhoptry protein, putative n=1 Tax=Plasmodium vinckei vinckei TaxID=54757 RepID=A0A449BYE3_PLAVN|nr:rhoptry protein, putative [Plasmodium vinckei vinckei]VEV58391.1 rhoptry protein, putative [Plasmodium vinckei vinckei]
MDQIDKNKKNNELSSTDLKLCDNISDDELNFSQENVWDTDINIIDDEISKINDNDDSLIRTLDNKLDSSNAKNKKAEESAAHENADKSINDISSNINLEFSENVSINVGDESKIKNIKSEDSNDSLVNTKREDEIVNFSKNDPENYEQLKIQYNKLMNKYNEYQNELATLNNKLEECETKCQSFIAKFKNEENKCNKLEKKYYDLEFIMKKKDIEFKENTEKLNKDINNKTIVVEQLEKCVEEYKNKLNESQDFFIRNEKRSLENMENKVACLENKLRDSTNENISLINQNNELSKMLNDLKIRKEENEKNLESLKYNIKMNEHESFSNIEKIQKQNSQIELLSNENSKNEKIIELLKNDKLKIEEENAILKKNLLTVQEELKKIEQHSYDIYEMKNYLETTLEKHKNVMDQLESEKNQKENLKIKIKSFLTEIKNSAIALKMYKMKCSFFINIIKNYEHKVSVLESKLENYEMDREWNAEGINKKICQIRKTQNENTLNSEDPNLLSKLDNEDIQNDSTHTMNNFKDDEKFDNTTNYKLSDSQNELLEEKFYLEEKIEKEINKKEEALNKLNNLETVLKKKNLEINDKNYKINTYKLLNKNLQKSITNYEHNINLMKENIHKLEKEIELKEIKNLVVPPKIVVNISKLSSFENNFKNELKELIGTSSNFLGNTFKYINENPLKKNLQTNPFFFSSTEKKNDNTTQIANNKKDNLISTYINDTVDVTGFAKNFIYNNMNKIPNFMNDNNYKTDEYQNELAKNENIFSEQSEEKQFEKSSLLSDAIWNKQNENSYEEKQVISTHSNIDDQNDKDNEKSEKSDNKYIDLFMGKKNMNTQGNKYNEKTNDGQVSQFFINTENKIKDLFDLGRKKNYNKPKEKTESFQDNTNDITTFSEKLFGSLRNIDNNNNYDIEEKNFNANQNDKFMENIEKPITQKTENNFYINKEKAPQEFNANEENKDDPELSFSGDDAQINDVWDEEIDIDNF